MHALYYSPLDIAAILNAMDLGIKEEAYLMQLIWEQERAFLEPKYRYDKRKFILKVYYWSHYFHGKEEIDVEFPIIEKELLQSQGTVIEKETYIVEDFSGLDLFFKSIRIKILYNKQRKYIRMKLRSLLRHYGYQRRSLKLMQYINACLFFYHLQPYLKGEVPCEIEEIGLDDMIIFREV